MMQFAVSWSAELFPWIDTALRVAMAVMAVAALVLISEALSWTRSK